jgi:pimeloyl-ACP methyl ester carboxylesterase
VPQLERETLADCGHMLHHDRPEALAARLLRFLG